MMLLKMVYHISALLKKAFYQILYGKHFSIGKKTTFRSNFSLMIGKEGHVSIGENCFLNKSCSINALNEIVIGNGTILGENVRLYDHNHKFNQINIPIKEQGYSIGRIKIGNNCWIGSNVIVLKNAEIGNNCVIGAGCIISGKINDCSIVRNSVKYYVEPITYI